MSARLRRAAGLVAFVGLVVAWAIVLRPVALGGQTLFLVVRGDSMLPTYQTGDLVILRSADAYRQGEVVAYRVPAGELGAGRIVIHRIVGGDAVSGYLVKGDHNPAVDPWRPKPSDIV
ncbi:MAG TPA: signal peptidase I, partial [Candidatus Dormibacteraeota bacterium]|nr:signal peptidase I [Candidatus Dormibacteraeota bacterium]